MRHQQLLLTSAIGIGLAALVILPTFDLAETRETKETMSLVTVATVFVPKKLHFSTTTTTTVVVPPSTTTTTHAHTYAHGTKPAPSGTGPAIGTTATPSLVTWDRLAQCESSGNWSIRGRTYSGGLQFDVRTWQSNGGKGYAWQATKAEQIRVATITWTRRGWGPWPACSRELGLR